MQTKVIKEEEFLKTVQITVPAAELQSSLQKQLSKLASTAKVDGFRPGKVPPEVIQQKYGTRLLNQAGEELMQAAFLKLVGEQKMKLSEVRSMKSVQLERGKDFIFETEYEVLPDVQLDVSAAITVERITAEMTEADVDDTIQALRMQQASYEDLRIVGTPAGAGHIATLDCQVQIPGQAQPNNKPNEMQVDMDSNVPSETLVAGVRGMMIGDTRTINDKVRLRVDANSDQMQEVPAVFQVRLKKLQKRILPELNAEFYRKVGVETGRAEEFRQMVRQNMEFELRRALAQIQRHRVYDTIIDAHKDLKVPPMRLEREAKRMREQGIAYWMEQTGAKTRPSEAELPLKSFEQRAERQLKAGMLLAEFAHQHSLNPSKQELESHIKALAQRAENPAQVEKEYLANEALYRQVHSILLEELAIQKYMATVKVADRKVSYKEALALSMAYI